MWSEAERLKKQREAKRKSPPFIGTVLIDPALSLVFCIENRQREESVCAATNMWFEPVRYSTPRTSGIG